MDIQWNKIVPGCVKETIEIKDKADKVIDTIQNANVATLDCVSAVVKNIIFGAFLFAGIVAVILIIYSGIKFILSGGDPKQVEGARKTMTYAIIGFVLILLSFAILNLISTVTGVNCIKFFGFTNCA